MSAPTEITEAAVTAAVNDALAAIAAAVDSAALKAVRTAHVGESSTLSQLNALMKDVPSDQKAAAGKLVVIPGEFDWDDVGDFASIAKLHSSGYKKDLAILGEGARVLADSSNGIVVSEAGRTIAVVGVKDIVIVDTPDALPVTTTQNAQRVKSVVDALRLAGRDDVL